MNIFCLDDDPWTSALWLDDVRKNKMVVESCQLLSTAMNVLDPGHGYDVYKTSFRNHPCAVWTRESDLNFFWLIKYTKALLEQRGARHKAATTLSSIERWYSETGGHYFPSTWRTPFVNCAANQSLGISLKWMTNTNAAYRAYLDARWQTDTIKLTWNNGEEPWWRSK